MCKIQQGHDSIVFAASDRDRPEDMKLGENFSPLPRRKVLLPLRKSPSLLLPAMFSHHFILALPSMRQLNSPRCWEREQKHGQVSSGFGDLNLSANGLCHKASVGGRQEMRKERGRGTDSGSSEAKESKQQVMPA